jgi:GTP-binding nuclear protein Ran
MAAPTETYKCVLVGDGGVGKTAYVKHWVTGQFERKYVATLGVEVHPVDFAHVRFNIWDTAGQEKFGGLRDGYYIQADCGMVCFDLTSRLTWKNVPKWLADLSQYTSTIVLVGFKCDLEPKVLLPEIQAFTAAHNLVYCPVSNKVGGEAMAMPIAHLMSQMAGWD